MQAENQILTKQKIARDSFILLLILIALDSVSRTLYVWAVPMVEGLFLIVIPTLFYITRMARDDLLDLRLVKNKDIIPCYCAIVGINLYAIIVFVRSGNPIVGNGKIGEHMIPFILVVFFGYQIIVLFHARHQTKQ